MRTVIPLFGLARWIYPLFFVMGLLFSLQSCTPSNAKTGGEHLAYADFKIPPFTLRDYDGNSYRSEMFQGKYVVLHFATTWCPFCNAEAPHLEQLYRNYKTRGVEVLVIDVKEPKALVKEKLIDKFGLSFPVLFDTDGAVASNFAPPDVLPDLARDEVMLASNLLIDPDGRILFFSLLDTANFDAELKELKSILDELL